jgi:hypothetical protein
VRGHAAWALGQIGTVQAQQVLTAALETEPDLFVKEEIIGALHPQPQ